MDWKEYDEATRATSLYPGATTGNNAELSYLALGLAGESGEVADCIKKCIRIGLPVTPADQEYVDGQKVLAAEELGDVLFYWTRLCYALGFAPEKIVQGNMIKLKKRMERGEILRRNA